MGLVTKAIAQSDITVLRSIARDTTDNIINVTGFPKDAEMIFTDDFVDSKRNRLNLFSKCYDDKGIRTKYANYVFVEVEDLFTEDGLVRQRHGQRNHSPFFNDEELGIKMFPVYSESEMNLALRFRSNSRSYLSNWINALRLRESNLDILIRSHIQYDYAIPYRFIEFIYDAWELRENVQGKGDTFYDYCQEHFSDGFMVRSDQSQRNHELIMNERQMHTRGWVDEKMFYNTRTIEEGVYEVTMQYRFRYPKIVGVTMQYPALVHNQFIKKEYVEDFLHPLVREIREKYERPLTYAGEHVLGADETYIYLGDGGARMIDWDPWFPERYKNSHQTILILPFAVDEKDPTLICNLRELPEEYLPAPVKDYLIKYADNWYVPNQMICSIEAWGVYGEELKHRTYLDEDNNIRTKEPMDVRHRNYMRISLQKDFARINPVHTRELLKDKDIFVPIIKLYNPDTIVTEDPKVFDDYMPGQPDINKLMGKTPMIVCNDTAGIIPWTYHYWLKMQQHTNKVYKGLNPPQSKGVGVYNITMRGRK